jgi:CPA1 family monovalent cation:H+ antiporter
MDLFHLFSILIVLSAGFAYINFRLLKLPNAIGLMLVSLIFSFFLIMGYYFLLSKKILPSKWTVLILVIITRKYAFMLF